MNKNRQDFINGIDTLIIMFPFYVNLKKCVYNNLRRPNNAHLSLHIITKIHHTHKKLVKQECSLPIIYISMFLKLLLHLIFIYRYRLSKMGVDTRLIEGIVLILHIQCKDQTFCWTEKYFPQLVLYKIKPYNKSYNT